jgi:hypothetical protein
MSGMDTFEFWQIVVMVIQSVLLLMTFLGAFYIGRKQNQINQQLIELQHQPSVIVLVDEDRGRLNVTNRGSHNVWLWGTQIEEDKKMDEHPRLITPKAFYYFPSLAGIKDTALQRCRTSGEVKLPFTLFLSTISERKYIVRCILFCKVTGGKVTVHSQTIGILQREWAYTEQQKNELRRLLGSRRMKL